MLQIEKGRKVFLAAFFYLPRPSAPARRRAPHRTSHHIPPRPSLPPPTIGSTPKLRAFRTSYARDNMKKKRMIIVYSILALLLYRALLWVTCMMSGLNKGYAWDLAHAYRIAIDEACHWDEVFASNGMLLEEISSPPSSRGRYMELNIILAEMPKGSVDLPAELKEFISSHVNLTDDRVLKVTIYAPATPEQKASIYLRDKTIVYEKDFFWWRLLYPSVN